MFLFNLEIIMKSRIAQSNSLAASVDYGKNRKADYRMTGGAKTQDIRNTTKNYMQKNRFTRTKSVF